MKHLPAFLLLFMLLLAACEDEEPISTPEPIIRQVAWQAPASPITAANAMQITLTGALNAHTGTIFQAEFTPDSRYYLTVGGDQNMFVWDATTGNTVFGVNDVEVQTAHLFNDGQSLLAVTRQDAIRVWSIATRAEVFTVTHAALITAIALSPDETQLAVGAKDGSVTFYDMENGTAGERFTAHEGGFGITSIVYLEDTLITVGEDGVVKRFALADVTTFAQLEASFPPPLAVITSADQSRLAVIRTGQINVYTLPDGVIAHTLATDAFTTVEHAEFSVDNRWLALATDLDAALIYDLASAQVLVALPGHGQRLADLALSPDRSLVVTGLKGGGAYLWNLGQLEQATTAEIQVPRAPLQQVRGLRLHRLDWSPDGKAILLLDERGLAYVISVP